MYYAIPKNIIKHLLEELHQNHCLRMVSIKLLRGKVCDIWKLYYWKWGGPLGGAYNVMKWLSIADIRDGNLKAILGLFFSLSRYKQQQKTQQQQQQQHKQGERNHPGEGTDNQGNKPAVQTNGEETQSR